MNIRTAETNKTPGVSYAVTDDGLELPVIDITHPAFATNLTAAELESLTSAFLAQVEQWRSLSPDVLERMRREVMQASVIGRGLLAAAGTFLTGMNTYLMKLGPDNLGPYAAPVDRQFAASLPLVALRLRLEDIARLQAEALAPPLAEQDERRLELLNIAGGPAIDSLNTLILLRREGPRLLEKRRITISVYDQDSSGPAFGARALDVLRAPGGRLEGLDVSFRHVAYHWEDTSPLREDMTALALDQAVWGASSEGGLFEYGSDAEVVANLEALRSPAGGSVVGSVTRADAPAVQNRGPGGVATIPRTLEAFAALALKAGWAIDRSIAAPLSFNVRLT